jgi:hypothetical protein
MGVVCGYFVEKIRVPQEGGIGLRRSDMLW